MLNMIYHFMEWLHEPKKTNDDIRKDVHIHHYVQVKSSGKTLKQIVQNASLDWDFTDLKVIETGYDVRFRYKGRLFFVNNDYLLKIYNDVCIHCGECIDYQSFKLQEIKDEMNKIDRDIEEAETAEKIYADKCMGVK